MRKLKPGVEITYNTGEDIHECIVGECDPEIGITIVSKEDHNLHVACFNGPLSPIVKNYREKYPDLKEEVDEQMVLFKKLYNYIAGCVYENAPILTKDLEYLTHSHDSEGYYGGSNPTPNDCAFNQ